MLNNYKIDGTLRKTLSFLALLWLPFFAAGQVPKVQVDGYFLRDSVELGQTVRYVLLSRHAPQAEVVFPDSSFKFAPFELVNKEYFTTRTQNGLSTDSTVYTLRTFQLQPVQRLQLQVLLFLNGDSLQLATKPDSVVLVQHVTAVADALPLKANTPLQYVPEKFNYLYWSLGLVAAAVFFTAIWALFGKSLNTRYKLYVLRKDQAQFQSRFNNAKERFRRLKTMEPLERAITLWKNYLTKLEEEEISSFTTKEITTFYEEDERVSNTLKVCDRAIYGNIISDDENEVAQALSQLAEFAATRYTLIRDSLRHVANIR
ncbi:hypothetical protein [Rufibacter sp. LB8]|uniref:hypothetical protein n=1 Tax=Rufibacter sp. LB8 TaxID=2777781 RepID=UPI00178C5FAE|nr:hypothetical protein [Rufibacter sp. LB8]